MRFVILVLLLSVTGILWGQSFQVAPCDDMYTDCIPNGPAHVIGELLINHETSSAEEQVMIKFDLAGLQGILIDTASLNLHRYFACGAGGGTTTSVLYMITEEWDEETWDPHSFIQYEPTGGIAYPFSGSTGAQNTWFEIDITEFFHLWMDTDVPNYGLVIVPDAGQRHSKFDSKEAANPDFYPYMNITLETNADDVLENPVISLSNYPNPFNPSTTIEFYIEQNQQNEQIDIEILNLKGQNIRQFSILNTQSSIVWDGTDQNNQPVASGVYLYRVKSGGYELTKKMILMK